MGTLAHQFADPIQHHVNELFANRVVSAGVVVGGILLACDQLLRVEQLTVHPSAHLIYKVKHIKGGLDTQRRKKNCVLHSTFSCHYWQFTYYRRFQVHKDGSGDMLSSASLTEEGAEGIVSTSNSLVPRHLSIGLDPMLQAVKLPASIADLDTSLTNVDGYTLALWEETAGTLVGCISGGFLKCKY